jgi:hypothetical protein
MDKIINFSDFLNEEVGLSDLGLKTNTLELILSKKFRKVLKEINHVISDKLLELHKESEPIYKQTFIDLADDSDKVSFIQSNKVLDLIEPDVVHDGWYRDDKDKNKLDWKEGYFDFTTTKKNKWITDVNQVLDLHYVEDDSPVWTKNRGTMKVSAFINKVFGAGTFPNNYTRVKRDEMLAAGKRLDDIESFVFMFTTEADKNIKKFEIVKGNDILYWYDEENYYETSGNLGSSCMRAKEKNKYMKFYAENPEKISMLILHPEQDHTKIIGRAIIWELDEPAGKKFMDRIYVSKDVYEYLYINYATNNKIMYKSSQAYGTEYDTILTDGTRRWIEMGTQLKALEYDNYPYLDTMQYYDIEKGWIANTKNKPGKYVSLTSADGSIYS